VSVIANNLCNLDRAIPNAPLCKSAHKPTYFTSEFVQAFAAHKLEGAAFHGISYVGDQPEIRKELPDGGLDIQDSDAAQTYKLKKVRAKSQEFPGVPGSSPEEPSRI